MQPFFLKRIIILFLLCYSLFLFGNSIYSLSDPDEAFYSLTAHEMAAHHEWMTPIIFGQPQFEKPPLTYWLLELAFKTWGESPFAARFFPAIFATIGVIAIYFIGILGFKDERKAFLSAIVLATSGFYAGMGKTVFTDMIFTVFMCLSFLMFIIAYTFPKRKGEALIGFYVFCALATLTKSPLGLVIPQAAVILFLLYQRQLSVLKTWYVPIGLLIYLVVALPWYWWTYAHYGQAFIHEFFYNDHWRRLLTAEHKANDHWFFYPLSMVGGVFPWSIILIAAGVDLFKSLKNSVGGMDYLVLSWLLVVLVVFQTAHSKLVSYILPLFPALALMIGNFLGNLLSQIQRRREIENLLFATFGFLALMGIGVMVPHKIYHHYISSLWPIYFLSGALIALAGIGITMTLKERCEEALYILSLVLFPVLLTVFMVSSDLDGYASSRMASSYIPPVSRGIQTVLTSKNNARGIFYFTGQNVAVMDSSPTPFFSPHPIPILNTPDKITAMLSAQPVTYGVIGKAAYKDLMNDCGKNYHIDLLAVIGYNDVVRIVKVKKA